MSTGTPRIAKSLGRLREQINELAPNRKKASDGWLGDSAHAARKSDHNPNAAGVVTALDVTHDPAGGCDCDVLVAALVESRDPRILNIIRNRRIISSVVSPWTWRPYNGSNPHTLHAHISSAQTPDLYDDGRDWAVRVSDGTKTLPPAQPGRPTLRRGSDARQSVELLQTLLNAAGGYRRVVVDGAFGEATESAVIAFQQRHGLHDDGVVGPYTWERLLEYQTAPPPQRQPDDPGDMPPDLSEMAGCLGQLWPFGRKKKD